MSEIAFNSGRVPTPRAAERRRRLLGVLAALLAALLGCRSDAERREQAQVANLAERIDRLRRAPNAEKRPLLDALAAAECVGPDACALKDLCLRAYRLHQRGLDGIASLRGAAPVDAGRRGSIEQRLRAAESDLTRAKELAERCAEEQVRAVRKVIL